MDNTDVWTVIVIIAVKEDDKYVDHDKRKLSPSDLEVKNAEGMKRIVIQINIFSDAAT